MTSIKCLRYKVAVLVLLSFFLDVGAFRSSPMRSISFSNKQWSCLRKNNYNVRISEEIAQRSTLTMAKSKFQHIASMN